MIFFFFYHFLSLFKSKNERDFLAAGSLEASGASLEANMTKRQD